MNAKPEVLISASAIGYYGSCGDKTLTEGNAAGNDFLAVLAKDWEAEALRAEALRARVVLARFGVILDRTRGALPKMALPFRFGAGGRIGNGKQWLSWVVLRDAVAAIRFALQNRELRGPVNIATPNPTTNAHFSKALAHALRRPALFPAPAFALRLAMGQMADALLLSSQRVLPQKLLDAGFDFADRSLPEALDRIFAES
jgi:uncharacterized protein (TIGR01777 family)